MAIALTKLQQIALIETVVVVAVDPSLYRLVAIIDGVEQPVVDERGKALSRRSINELQALLENCQIGRLLLRHESAYDEMIGQPQRACDNRLEVPIGRIFSLNATRQKR